MYILSIREALKKKYIILCNVKPFTYTYIKNDVEVKQEIKGDYCNAIKIEKIKSS